MSWWAWGAVAWMSALLALISYAAGLVAWDRFQRMLTLRMAAKMGKAAERADHAWAAQHGIDLSHTALPSFLGKRR